jgi:hypothetical protein
MDGWHVRAHAPSALRALVRCSHPQITIIHLLGRAPMGDLDCTRRTALRPEPDWYRFEMTPRRCMVTRIRWALEPAELTDGKKTSAEEKDYDPGLEEGDDLSHTYPVCPEPTTPRKPPARLARLRVSIGCEAFASGLSCPFLWGGACAPFGWSAGASGEGHRLRILSRRG